jgi:hypothetical protein
MSHLDDRITNLERAQFNALTPMEKYQFGRRNPEVYASLRDGALGLRRPPEAGAALAWQGKTWEQLTPLQRFRLGQQDRALFDQLRADAGLGSTKVEIKVAPPKKQELTWKGKTWKELTPLEKYQLGREDRQLYEKMRRASERA